MEEQFHENREITRDKIRELQDRRDAPAFVRFGIQYFLLIASAVTVVWRHDQDAWQWIPPMVLFALMTMSMFALAHETVHKTAIRARWLNEILGWLACLPIYYVPEGFRHFHFAHHRAPHTPGEDPEIAPGGIKFPPPTDHLFTYLGWSSGIPILLFKVVMILLGSIGHGSLVWKKFFFFVPVRFQRKVRWQSRIFLCIHAAYITMGILWFPGLLFLLAGLLLGHSMLSLYLVCEHNGLPHQGTVVERTRTIRPNVLLNFLMWNMPYHTEHHAYPAVPWHALPRLHQVLKQDIPNIAGSRLGVHLRILGQLLKGRPFRDPAEPSSTDARP